MEGSEELLEHEMGVIKRKSYRYDVKELNKDMGEI